MFGTSTLKGLHLTHHVADVHAIELSSNAAGEARALRIANAQGQTLVLLT
jgi:hypothetical protein